MRISDWSSDVCSSDLTLPRAASEAAWLQARLHRDQGASAARRAGGAGGAPLGASPEATAPAAGGHAGAPGRLALCLAALRSPAVRPAREAGPRPQLNIPGLPARGRGDVTDASWLAR